MLENICGSRPRWHSYVMTGFYSREHSDDIFLQALWKTFRHRPDSTFTILFKKYERCMCWAPWRIHRAIISIWLLSVSNAVFRTRDQYLPLSVRQTIKRNRVLTRANLSCCLHRRSANHLSDSGRRRYQKNFATSSAVHLWNVKLYLENLNLMTNIHLTYNVVRLFQTKT